MWRVTPHDAGSRTMFLAPDIDFYLADRDANSMLRTPHSNPNPGAGDYVSGSRGANQEFCRLVHMNKCKCNPLHDSALPTDHFESCKSANDIWIPDYCSFDGHKLGRRKESMSNEYLGE